MIIVWQVMKICSFKMPHTSKLFFVRYVLDARIYRIVVSLLIRKPKLFNLLNMVTCFKTSFEMLGSTKFFIQINGFNYDGKCLCIRTIKTLCQFCSETGSNELSF